MRLHLLITKKSWEKKSDSFYVLYPVPQKYDITSRLLFAEC